MSDSEGDWTALDEANRAVQAAWGFALLLAPPAAREEMAASAFKELESMQGMSRADLDLAARRARLFFGSIHQRLPPHHPLAASEDALWGLLVEGFDFSSLQLRAYPNWLRQLGLIDHFGRVVGMDGQSLMRLPFTTQVVFLGGDGGNVRILVENPVKLAYLDLLLLLTHARVEHRALEAAGAVRPESWRHMGRLDAYSRLAVLRAVSVVEGVLADYGALMAGAAPASDTIKTWLSYTGVTRRVRTFFDAWKEVPPSPPRREPEIEEEFSKFIEMRNRVAHPDDRPSAWQAFRNAPANQRLAPYPRAQALVRCSSYGIPGSHIGYEYGVACYAVDVTTRMIDYVLRVAFPDGPRWPNWLGVPRDEDGLVDFQRFHEADPMLEIDTAAPPSKSKRRGRRR